MDEAGVPGAQMPGRFFPGARLNFADNPARYDDEHRRWLFRNERDTVRSSLTKN